MAMKPLTEKAIAITEKKMDMTLDDIIKMSKGGTSKAKKPRASNKSQKPFNSSTSQGNSGKLRRFMDSRSSLRQGALAQRRSNFQGNQFPLAKEFARKAAAAPIRNKPLNHNRMANNRSYSLLAGCRVAAPMVQVKVAERGFSRKMYQAKVQPKRTLQTLDSLFANMKEQRMRSQQNNVQFARGGGGGGQQQHRGRGRFFQFGNN
ncbi:hypothetical protein GIB67_042201 [Kingdonia uniflora]|uniref:Uncharacterized protein n=1 Tax=Kingdonia uniflora TaxID=39325 RepID=A0A7J7LDX8_9MAGN|nr:hypothetical protein GIB67_042201 [Kingdonia uniflora]